MTYICHTYRKYHSQDKGDTSPILLSPDSGHCSSSHSIGMNVNNMVNTSRICKSISLQFPRWRDPHHLLFDAEKVSKSALWCFESLKTRSLSGWQQHGFPSPVAPTSLLLTSPGALTLWHCDIVSLCHNVWWSHKFQTWHWSVLWTFTQPTKSAEVSKQALIWIFLAVAA